MIHTKLSKMRRFLMPDDKFIVAKRRESFLKKNDAGDERLKSAVRRAVKNIAVPADLESKVLTSLRKQS